MLLASFFLFSVMKFYSARLPMLTNYLLPKRYSSKSASKSLSKYVFISESTDIYVNLALEDWLYHNWNFASKHILLLWRNTEAIVIGRHQNPWLEASIKADFNFIQMARRNSGGGAVYHDLHNLNLSFMTSKESYDRDHNLNIIKRSLENEWGIECKINSRSDIVCQSKKISGTASKVCRKAAYHHCTILVDVNKNVLASSLLPQKMNIISNATSSKRSPTLNLRELNSSINIERLMSVIGLEYLKIDQNENIESKGFQMVIPEEKYFPGINQKIDHLRSWDWVYGRTPKFKVCDSSDSIKFQVLVELGLIKDISFYDTQDFPVKTLNEVSSPFLEQKFCYSLIEKLKLSLDHAYNKKIKTNT